MKKREEKRRIARALIEIKCSKTLSGQTGVFALTNLRKGTLVADAELFGEEFRSWKEHILLDNQTKKMIDKYCLGTKEGFYAPFDINWLSIPWHINHSCSGNVGFDEKGNIVTIRYNWWLAASCLLWMASITFFGFYLRWTANTFSFAVILAMIVQIIIVMGYDIFVLRTKMNALQ
jgi:hypothetical protein